MKPALHLIEAEPSPADRLRDAFTREDELLRELARVREEQRVARRDYARERRLMMLPDMAVLRRVVGA